MGRSIKLLTKQLAEKLATISPTPILEAELIVAEATGLDRAGVLAEGGRKVGEKEMQKALGMVTLRLDHKPLQQILGRQDFYGNNFEINDQVLIPRSDTEMLVKYALDHIKTVPGKALEILDLGTGSGAIAISLLIEASKQNTHIRTDQAGKNIYVYASDISSSAIKLAKQNAARLLPPAQLEQITFIRSDVWAGLAGKKFDLIISNPPYLPGPLQKSWQKELDFEPRDALISGEDGFEMYRKIFAGLDDVLGPGGIFIGEFHSPLSSEILKIAASYSYEPDRTRLLPDLSGVNRFIEIKT